MNYQVAIPTDFFLREAKSEYYDYQTRLVQELLQNSLDAGSTVIRLTFDALGYKCEDNGKGMSQDRMVTALLTMGGSVKESGATGGFGAAKKLLLFAHKAFSIHSNGTLVEGQGLSYGFKTCMVRRGTAVRSSYANPEDFANVESKARSLFAKCNFVGRAKIYLNGVLFTDYLGAPLAKTVAFLGDVYAQKRRTIGANNVCVLHNGLFMFDRYVTDLNRVVFINVAAKSTEVFTQNRDGFKGDSRIKFDALVAEMTIDKKSIVKPKPRKFIYDGFDRFISHINKTFTVTPAIQAAINSVCMERGNFTPAEFTDMVAAAVQMNAKADVCDKATAESIATYVRNNATALRTDFHFDLADSKFNKVPWWFVPNTGKKKFTQLAALWKVCVSEVLKANGVDQNFVIGFTFSSEASAAHSRKDGVSCYMVNPKSKEIDKGTKEEKVISLLTIACHEVVHSRGFQQHDEEFVREFHNLLLPTLTKAPSWRQLLALAKEEKI